MGVVHISAYIAGWSGIPASVPTLLTRLGECAIIHLLVVVLCPLVLVLQAFNLRPARLGSSILAIGSARHCSVEPIGYPPVNHDVAACRF